MLTDEEEFELLDEDLVMNFLENNELIKIVYKKTKPVTVEKLRIRVMSPIGTEIAILIKYPLQNFEGLKNYLSNIFCNKGEKFLPNAVMLTNKNGFEYLDEDLVMNFLENNELIKIVYKKTKSVAVKKPLNFNTNLQPFKQIPK